MDVCRIVRDHWNREYYRELLWQLDRSRTNSCQWRTAGEVDERLCQHNHLDVCSEHGLDIRELALDLALYLDVALGLQQSRL